VSVTPFSPPAMERFAAALVAVGSKSSNGRDWTCPAHADVGPSLSVSYRDDRVLFNCHAGCPGYAVLAVLGLEDADLSDAAPAVEPAAVVPAGPPPSWAAKPHDTMQYGYTDAAGKPLFTVHRRVKDGKKTFLQQAADGTWSIRGIDPVLLGLPRVLDTAALGGAVHVVEGEKDATALYLSGEVGTCNPGGAKKWRDALADALAGCSEVVVWRDRDWIKTGDGPDARTPGDTWARAVVDSLARRAIPYRVVEAAGGKDAWDHLAGGYSLAQAVSVTLDGAGGADLEDTELMPASDTPMPVARRLEQEWLDIATGLPVRYYWRGSWLVWKGAHWAEQDDDSFRSGLYLRMEHAVYEKTSAAGSASLVKWNPGPRTIGPVEAAARAVRMLAPEVEAGSTLDPDEGWTPPQGARVAFSNGVLDVATRKFTEPSPAYLNTSSVPFAYDPAAPVPVRWLAFLGQVMPGDGEAVQLLQEWFGYVLSGMTDQQKILYLQGAPRGGKGTVARILKRLVGEVNFVGPTLAGMSTDFGLAPMIGKSLAVISDMRMPERNAQLVLERLLSISGEDTLSVNRKYRADWNGQLPVRLMFLSNNLPAFRDASGAFASRLLLIRMPQSFLGREDPGLEARLATELQGILLWALEGLARLRARGHFVQPATSVETLAAVSDAGSPLGVFLATRTVPDPGGAVSCKALFAAYQQWGTEENGQKWTATQTQLGREMAELGYARTQRQVSGRREGVYPGLALAPLPGAAAPVFTGSNPFAPGGSPG